MADSTAGRLPFGTALGYTEEEVNTMNKQQFGNFIAKNRKASGLTQKELAQRLHVTDKAVSKWERALSYPDVTLLEPLAEALGMGIEELIACRKLEKQEDNKEEEPMENMKGEKPVQNLMEISRENLKSEQRKHAWQMVLALALMLATTLGVIWYSRTYVHEQRESIIVLKEQTERGSYLYLQNEGHLLRLECGEGVDFDGVQLADERGGKQIYRLDCRWNRRTYEGSVSVCEPAGVSLGSVENMLGASLGLDYPLFGHRQVWSEYTYGYRDPDLGEVYTFTFWAEEEGVRETLLKVEQCLGYTQEDWDQDGERELLVRTRWPEKPYTVYDMEDGVIRESWPDTLPPELAALLMTDQERYEQLQREMGQTPKKPAGETLRPA